MTINRRPWKRLAGLRSSRRRRNEIPPPEGTERDPVPPLEPPDDDREFVPWPRPVWPGLEPTPAA